MTIGLRGHHLLCLLGYRGMGYSEHFCENMTAVYETLRSKPETSVRIVLGPDDLCAAFPADQVPHCENRTVYERDADIVARLGLQAGMELRWDDILKRVSAQIEPGDIGHLCATCRWQPYGVCEEGVRIVANGGELPKLPAK